LLLLTAGLVGVIGAIGVPGNFGTLSSACITMSKWIMLFFGSSYIKNVSPIRLGIK
jgi:hypothetical protein